MSGGAEHHPALASSAYPPYCTPIEKGKDDGQLLSLIPLGSPHTCEYRSIIRIDQDGIYLVKDNLLKEHRLSLLSFQITDGAWDHFISHMEPLPFVYYKYYGGDHMHFSCPSCDNKMVGSLEDEDWCWECENCHTIFHVLDPEESD